MTKLGPPPPASSTTTHRVMVSNRGRDTGLELKFRHALRESGLRGYRVNFRVGDARVDVAFPSVKLAILVNGCFWHHCRVCGFPIPKTHKDFWERKFLLTHQRDIRVRRLVKSRGWRLIEIWEHQIREDVGGCVGLVATAAGRNVQASG